MRALTRDPGKPAAQALAEAGAEIFAADNDDRPSLDAAFRGAYGVYSVQNFWLPNVGAEGEIRQGKAVADAAKAAGVKHLVYSSVGAAHRGMGQAHFASKHEIEEYIRSLNLPHTILRPVFFMENYNWQRPQITNGTFTGMGLRPEKGVQMVAVDDIGAFAALAFGEPEFLGETVELAGDELTEAQIAETFTRVIGRPVGLAAPQMPEGARPAPEMLAMFQFFNGAGLRRRYRGPAPALPAPQDAGAVAARDRLGRTPSRCRFQKMPDDGADAVARRCGPAGSTESGVKNDSIRPGPARCGRWGTSDVSVSNDIESLREPRPDSRPGTRRPSSCPPKSGCLGADLSPWVVCQRFNQPES